MLNYAHWWGSQVADTPVEPPSLFKRAWTFQEIFFLRAWCSSRPTSCSGNARRLSLALALALAQQFSLIQRPRDFPLYQLIWGICQQEIQERAGGVVVKPSLEPSNSQFLLSSTEEGI